MNGKRKVYNILIILAIIIIVIVLPNGVDDAFTTIPLIAFLGIHTYLILALGVLLLLIINFKHIKRMIKRLNRRC